jgi:phosphoglycerate dehydrogenase-like enzyme
VSHPAPRRVLTIADDDPVLRLVRFALTGDRAADEAWLHDYFSPEPFDPASLVEIAGRRGLYGTTEVRYVHRADEDRLLEISAGSDAIICRRAVIDRTVIAASPALRVINRLGELPTGIDLEAAARAGVVVNCIERPSLAVTAEHAILLMLAAGKQLVRADAATRAGAFDPAKVKPINNVAYNWPGFADLTGLFGKTLGIIGLGQVGVLVAKRAAAFGMEVLYTKPNRLPAGEEARLGLTYVGFEDLLERADFVSLHAREIPQTHHLFNADAFHRMKPTAIFVNTSRGSLVDETALAEALESSQIAGAAIDTHEVEPRAPGDRLSKLDTIIMTPHIAGGSRLSLLHEVDRLLTGIGG